MELVFALFSGLVCQWSAFFILSHNNVSGLQCCISEMSNMCATELCATSHSFRHSIGATWLAAVILSF